MQVVKVKIVTGCLEGTNVKDLFLDKGITKDFIGFLGSLGKLIYFDESPKPIFKIIVRGEYTIKGTETTRLLRVLLPDDGTGDRIIEFIREYISRYVSGTE